MINFETIWKSFTNFEFSWFKSYCINWADLANQTFVHLFKTETNSSDKLKWDDHPIGRGCGICWLHLCRWTRNPNKATCFLKKGSLWLSWLWPDSQSSYMTCNTPSWLDRWFERPDPIDQLVLLSPNTNMIISTIFFKLFLQKTKIRLLLS